MIGQNEGRIPVEAVRWSSGRALRLNRSPLTCFQMPTADCSVLAFPVDQVRILLIHSANESIAAADRKPILIESSAVLTDGWTAPRTVVLQPTDDPVRIFWTDGNVIELADRCRVDVIPIVTAIMGDIESAIATDNHVSTIVWIDPKIVTICVYISAKIPFERGSAVAGAELIDTQDVDSVRVAWVHFDDAEVHGSGV